MPNRSDVLWRLPVAMMVATIPLGSGCLPSVDSLDTGPLTSTFAVSDVYTPSGFMGDGAQIGHLYMSVNTDCPPRPAGAQGYCYTFTYYQDTSPMGVRWAGVFWVFPANNWGTRLGHMIDTTKFHQIRYSASIEWPRPLPEFADMDPKGVQPNFFYGNIMGFENTDAIGGKVFPPIFNQLTPYRIPFPDGQITKPDDSLIGGFGWSIEWPNWADPKSPLIIHIDDVVWDTAVPPDPPMPGNP